MSLDLSTIIDRDAIRHTTVTVKEPTPKGEREKIHRVNVGYYPNRLTTEQDDEDEPDFAAETEDGSLSPAAPAWDVAFCDFMAEWDVTGELPTKRGEVVPGTGAGIPVPLDPYVTQYIPLWFKQGIQSGCLEHEFPSRNGSRRSRRG